jgi:hypothetical protein
MSKGHNRSSHRQLRDAGSNPSPEDRVKKDPCVKWPKNTLKNAHNL